MSVRQRPLRRVFLSHTSELAEFPVPRSFVAAAKDAVADAGDAVVDMSHFTSHPQPPADVCRAAVRDCDVYVVIAGFRYGSCVLDDPPLSYTELEFAEANTRKIPILAFLLDEATTRGQAAMFIDRDHGQRQDVFRTRILDSGVTATFVSSPEELAEKLARALIRLDSPDSAGAVRVGAIPPLADCFQDRAELEVLRELGLGKTAVLTGLGGVGKSQLAAAFARACADRLDVLLWSTSGSREAILTCYAAAASRLGYSASEDVPQAADWFLTLLQHETNREWLVILDDVQDPMHVRGLWPEGPNGRTLVTTRRTDSVLAGGRRHRVEVSSFTPRQARRYLAEKLQADPSDARLHELDQLTAELGLLPLAMAQAAAFMADRGENCAGYRRRFGDRRSRLPDVFPQDALADDYTATVAATWSVSIEAADRLTPIGASRPLLELASMLDPNGFPITLIYTTAVAAYLTDHRITRSEQLDRGNPDCADDDSSPVDDVQCRDALHNLARFSLLTHTPTTTRVGRVRVHALVQRAATEHLTAARLRNVAWAAADALLAVWPRIERETRLGQLLRANATSLADRAGSLLWEPTGHPVLWRTGTSLGECGLLDAAITYWTNMVATSERTLGPDHPSTLSTRLYLAYWRGQAGDPMGALIAFGRLLADRIRVLGPDHPDTLITRDHIACRRGQSGNPAGAIAEFGQLLADQLRVLGPDHPNTLTTRSNLAHWRGEAGHPASAATAFEQLLTDQLRVLGPDHPKTLTTRSNLAHWRGEAGHPASAATAFEQLLTDQLRILGADHPDTLSTRQSLARWRGKAGDPTGAATAYDQLLSDQLRVLGPDHPNTLTTRHDLAHWRGEGGDTGGAVKAFEHLLTDRLRVLGAENPDTLRTRHNLADYYGKAGQPARAVAEFAQLLTDRLRILGAEHPHTRDTRDSLEHWQQSTDAAKMA
jgi:Domain of unknown function (DUF4062)/Tetratricopeptide repeat/NB-ARC domain